MSDLSPMPPAPPLVGDFSSPAVGGLEDELVIEKQKLDFNALDDNVADNDVEKEDSECSEDDSKGEDDSKEEEEEDFKETEVIGDQIVLEEDMVRVFLRLRPTVSSEGLEFGPTKFDTLNVVDESTVKSTAPKDSQAFKNRETGGEYKFTRVFDKPTPQTELFEDTTSGLVSALVNENKDGLLFAYGVTNAGKTYTVEGTDENPGIIPRTLERVFSLLSESEDHENKRVQVSYLQVYNEQVHDLQVNKRLKDNLSIKFREDGVQVVGLRETRIKNADDGLEILNSGRELRATHETKCNVSSSRSHSVFVIKIDEPETSDGKGKSAVSSRKPARLYIVDLAGTERSARTQTSRSRQAEANNINVSLMNLMRCLDTLRLNQKNKRRNNKKKAQLVPFRESKLTMLFRDCLVGGNCGGVAMIVNASPHSDDYDETAHALKYGALVKNVKVARSCVKTRSNSAPRYGDDGRKITKAQTNTTELSTLTKVNEDELAYDENMFYEMDPDEVVPLEEHPIFIALQTALEDAHVRLYSMEAEIRQEVAAEMDSHLAQMEKTCHQRVEEAKLISNKKSDQLINNLRQRMGEGEEQHTYTMAEAEVLAQKITEYEEEKAQMQEEIDQLRKHRRESGGLGQAKKTEAMRPSFGSLDKALLQQLHMIEQLQEDLTDERALHEKTIKQLESATQLAKDAQIGEEEKKRQVVKLQLELEGLRTKMKKKLPKTPMYQSKSDDHSKDSGSKLIKPGSFSRLLGRHKSACSSDELWAPSNLTKQEIVSEFKGEVEYENMQDTNNIKSFPQRGVGKKKGIVNRMVHGIRINRKKP